MAMFNIKLLVYQRIPPNLTSPYFTIFPSFSVIFHMFPSFWAKFGSNSSPSE